MEARSFANRIIDLLYEEIKKKGTSRLVWLGVSPGIPLINSALGAQSVEMVQVVDNDISKQGWIINIDEKNTDQKCLKVESVNCVTDDKHTLYICANTHYNDFVIQLSEKGVDKERIVDLNDLQLRWMKSDMEKKVSSYYRLLGRELQLEELKILKWFRDYCKDNNLRWFLGEGTLLGAVRHKGFIPWDDDIDTFMPYDDYLKLLEIMRDVDGYRLVDWRVDNNYPFQFAKIIKEKTFQLHPTPFGYFTLGCYIDIFPLAGYPSEERDIQAKYRRNKELDFIWDKSYIDFQYYGNSIIDCRKSITNEKYAVGFDDAIKVGTMQQIAGNAWAINRENFEDEILMEFEDDRFPIPKGYDAFLTARYNNYMELPPLEKRRVHSFPTYIVR